MLVIGCSDRLVSWPDGSQMTQMPELVAVLHSLVGLAAVFVGFNADLELGPRRWPWTRRRAVP